MNAFRATVANTQQPTHRTRRQRAQLTKHYSRPCNISHSAAHSLHRTPNQPQKRQAEVIGWNGDKKNILKRKRRKKKRASTLSSKDKGRSPVPSFLPTPAPRPLNLWFECLRRSSVSLRLLRPHCHSVVWGNNGALMAVQHTHTTHWGPLALTKVEGWNETMVGRWGRGGGGSGGKGASGGRGRMREL